MKRRAARRSAVMESVGIYAVELAVYAVLVTAYFFLVLHFLGDWLKQLFDVHRTAYAVVALALIIGQGVVLELVTMALLRFLQRRRTGR